MQGVKLFFLLLICILIIGYAVKPQKVSFSFGRPEQKYQDVVLEYVSDGDMDGDGLDDQSDILAGALSYAATRPQYKSNYYAGGYPDDGYGVCTDLVAFALLDAGFDLRELINADILANPGVYDVDTPDKNIDFRRVKNIWTYLSRHAITMTNDITDIDSWQGGDIVIFDDHIGIVSNVRNSNGVPYVIHHYTSYQAAYEEDILETRDDLMGHYRMSW